MKYIWANRLKITKRALSRYCRLRKEKPVTATGLLTLKVLSWVPIYTAYLTKTVSGQVSWIHFGNTTECRYAQPTISKKKKKNMTNGLPWCAAASICN